VQNPQQNITRYALILFALLLLAIMYTYFSQPTSPVKKLSHPAMMDTPHATMQIVNYPSSISSLSASTIDTKNQTMKLDHYKVPVKQQKLSDLLPEDLKHNIKTSLLTEEQLKSLTAEERFRYKQMQKKLAKVLREIGKTEAENQKLQGYISHVEEQKVHLKSDG
jgi:hypothetical protein